jgi:hypothetical protein
MNDLPTIFSIYIVGATLAIVGSVARTLILNGQNYSVLGFFRRFVTALFASSCLFFIAVDLFLDSARYVIFSMGITGFFSEDVIEILKKILFKRLGNGGSDNGQKG